MVGTFVRAGLQAIKSVKPFKDLGGKTVQKVKSDAAKAKFVLNLQNEQKLAVAKGLQAQLPGVIAPPSARATGVKAGATMSFG